MRPKIVLFGDSITEGSFGDGGWGAALANHFSRTVDVVLRGYDGYNSRWALKVADKALRLGAPAEEIPPLAVTVFFGANDACLPDRSGAFLHVPIHEYKQNLRDIISFIKKRWASSLILLITPPPIDEEGRIRHFLVIFCLLILLLLFHQHRYPYGENHDGLPERTNEYAGAYAKACISVAKESGFPVVDIWSKMQQVPGWQKACLRCCNISYENIKFCYRAKGQSNNTKSCF